MTIWPAYVPVHPAAELFPLMNDADLDALAADIAVNGLRMPIVRDADGRILDGRNRYLACQRKGHTPAYTVERGEPWQYVISTNLHRRHLTESQRAMIAATVADRYNGQNSRSRSSAGEADLVQPITRRQAAQLLDVSTSQIDRARRVTANATEELKALVAQGHVPITTAARVATTLGAAEQHAFVAKVQGGANPRVIARPDQRPLDLIEGSGRLGATPATPPVNKPLTGTARIRKRVDTLDVDTIHRLTSTWDGYATGLADISGIDPAATAEQRRQWDRAITKTIRALGKFRKIIRETDTP